MPPSSAPQLAPGTGLLVLAFALLYLTWGSTYLAIAVALHGGPPLAMAALRMLIAGAILHAVQRLRGEAAVTPRQWLAAALVGGLLMVLGNGLLWLVEARVPSGQAALVLALVPVWMTVLAWAVGHQKRPRWQVWVGMVLGVAGVAWLSGYGRATSGVERWHLLDFGLLLVSSLSWALGSVLARVLPAPRSPLLASAAQTWAGGVLLLLVSLLHRDWHVHMFSGLKLSSASALLYLIVAGSLVGYSCYVFLLRHVSVSLASTNAFVNPIIAVLLGWLILGEPVSPRVLISGALIVLAVALIVLGSAAASPAQGSPQRTTATRGEPTRRATTRNLTKPRK